MTEALSPESSPRKPLRLWPGVVIVALQWLAWQLVPRIAPDAAMYAVVGGVIGGGLALLIWWLFFSRAPWLDRVGALLLMPLAVYLTRKIVHPSIWNAAMGMFVQVFSIPLLGLALVASAAATRRLADGPRRAWMAAAILLACTPLLVVRTGGMSGDGNADWHWRWTPTPEDRLLAQGATEPAPLPPAAAPATETPRAEPIAATTAAKAASVPSPPVTKGSVPATVSGNPTAEWPGFRGAGRDSVIRGMRIETDWAKSPPVRLWRRPVGPGWSSFAVRGDHVYTQEQRGENEIVSCYRLDTGEPVWSHRDRARFWESNAGAGPRATPTLANGRVYTLGGTGILNVLDARDGSVVWSRNAVADTGAKIPTWGIASSPAVVGDVVVAATAGSLAGYEEATGNLRWLGPKGGWGYSSPHLTTIDGVAQVVLLNGTGAIGVNPSDGAVLWNHSWPGDGIVQPAVLAGSDVLIGSGSGMAANNGMARINVAHSSGGWSVTERWTTNGLKPYFSDYVVHDGYAFGFDGNLLACIDLADGKRKWKGGRYGQGQLVLLPERGPAAGPGRRGRSCPGGGQAGSVHRSGAGAGHRGQDLEPSGAGRRRAVGAQRRGDGRAAAHPGQALIVGPAWPGQA